jgi:hypothetical protein
MDYITIVKKLTWCGMSGKIVVQLKDGTRILANEVEVLPRRNGDWIRCVRGKPSPRMEFDETTTYYHLDRDVEEMYTSSDGRSTATVETERSSFSRARIAKALCDD